MSEELVPDMWYFRQQRSWVVQWKDKAGNQVGDADYVYTRGEAEALVKAGRPNGTNNVIR